MPAGIGLPHAVRQRRFRLMTGSNLCEMPPRARSQDNPGRTPPRRPATIATVPLRECRRSRDWRQDAWGPPCDGVDYALDCALFASKAGGTRAFFGRFAPELLLAVRRTHLGVDAGARFSLARTGGS